MSSKVSVGTVVVARMEGCKKRSNSSTRVVEEKGCSGGGIICGNNCGTGLMGAVAATHHMVVVAVLAAWLRSSTEKKESLTSCPQAQKNCQPHQVGVSRRGIRSSCLGV